MSLFDQSIQCYSLNAKKQLFQQFSSVAENAGRAVIISSQSEISILSDSSILYNMNFKYDVTNYVCSKKNVSHLHIL